VAVATGAVVATIAAAGAAAAGKFDLRLSGHTMPAQSFSGMRDSESRGLSIFTLFKLPVPGALRRFARRNQEGRCPEYM
jgi:hypothetical protein